MLKGGKLFCGKIVKDVDNKGERPITTEHYLLSNYCDFEKNVDCKIVKLLSLLH